MDHEDEDCEIRARLATNDSSALDMIWTVYANDLLGYLVSILCVRQDAEDALQDVFITVVKNRLAVSKALNLKAYLFRLSRNVAYNRIKKSKRRQEREFESLEWLVPEVESEWREGQTHRLQRELAALPEKQRSVIVLKFFRNKTFREIADVMDISENTAASRFRYGMAKLKDSMKEVL